MVWKLRVVSHSFCAWSQQFSSVFDIKTVFTGPYEGVIAEMLQGSGGTAVAGWRGMKRFHFLEVPVKAELQRFEVTMCLCGQRWTTRSVFGAFVPRQRIQHFSSQTSGVPDATCTIEILTLKVRTRGASKSRKREVMIGEFLFQEQQRGSKQVFGGVASKDMFQSLVFRAKAWTSPRQGCAEVFSIKFSVEWRIVQSPATNSSTI